MKSTSNTFVAKKLYSQPMIEIIIIDNEISLQLQSGAPTPPIEPVDSRTPNFINQDPFKSSMA